MDLSPSPSIQGIQTDPESFLKSLSAQRSFIGNKGMFKGDDYKLLSNFTRTINDRPLIDNQGVKYFSSENYYMAQKTTNIEQRRKIAEMSPAQAKKYTRSLAFRNSPGTIPSEEWESIRLSAMEEAVRKKFAPNTPELKFLMETRFKYLAETNTWGDDFWGIPMDSKGNFDFMKSLNQNRLGKMLMQIRKENLEPQQQMFLKNPFIDPKLLSTNVRLQPILEEAAPIIDDFLNNIGVRYRYCFLLCTTNLRHISRR
jgi:ribA/ribD-fused uncharacterized protein